MPIYEPRVCAPLYISCNISTLDDDDDDDNDNDYNNIIKIC